MRVSMSAYRRANVLCPTCCAWVSLRSQAEKPDVAYLFFGCCDVSGMSTGDAMICRARGSRWQTKKIARGRLSGMGMAPGMGGEDVGLKLVFFDRRAMPMPAFKV
jgi:hypothetical protein